MTNWRRFEVMLPCRLNSGEPLSRKWIKEALDEISGHQVSEGNWWHAGVMYGNGLVRILVDVVDSTKNRKWMKEFKKRWKERLQQLELRMVSYRIDIE